MGIVIKPDSVSQVPTRSINNLVCSEAHEPALLLHLITFTSYRTDRSDCLALEQLDFDLRARHLPGYRKPLLQHSDVMHETMRKLPFS